MRDRIAPGHIALALSAASYYNGVMPRLASSSRARPRRRRGAPLRLPRNAVYDAIRAAGGPTLVGRELAVSSATLARWRRAGVVHTAADALRLARLATLGLGATAQLLVARALAGLDHAAPKPGAAKRAKR